MKIAILSSIAWRTPPRKYGPWEQVSSNIAEGLVERGIDVTLFASGDSITNGKLDSVSKLPYAEHLEIDPKVAECLHISHLMEQANDFDIIHNNFDFLPLSYSRLIKTPMVTTIHGFSSPKITRNTTVPVIMFPSVIRTAAPNSVIRQPSTMVLIQASSALILNQVNHCFFLEGSIPKKGSPKP